MRTESITEKKYISYISQANNGENLYKTKIWLDHISKSFNAKLTFLKTSHNQSILALTPFMTLKKGPFYMTGSPLRGLYTDFLGPIYFEDLSEDQQQEIIKSQHSFLSSMNDYIEWGVEYDSKQFDILNMNLTNLGYEYTSRSTILIDLSVGHDEIWKRFHGRARNMIRKSEKNGVEVKLINPNPGWIKQYYSMLEDTFAFRNQAVPHPIDFYDNLRLLSTQGKAFFFSAEAKGEMIAGAIFLDTGNRLLYLSGTSNKLGMKYAANSLIQWQAIKTAIENKIDRYDMGGLGVPSIDKFKKSFGGDEISHHRWVYRKRIFKFLEPIAVWLYEKGFLQIHKN